MRLRRLLALIAAAFAALGLAASASSTSAVSAARAIANLNAQRAANGIPAGIVENPVWSRACDKHITYMRRTGERGHHENPRSPHYTLEGNWGGTNSVLAYGDNWASENPWETAPIHLAQILAPGLTSTGVADRNGYVCATTWPGFTRQAPAEATVVTYPGNGVKGFYSSMVARENPFVPGDLVGLPQGTRTGPHLYAFLWGAEVNEDDASLRSASLRGPSGALAVRHVDWTTDRIGRYLPNGTAIVIPVKPLRPSTTYEATVTYALLGRTVEHSWSFTTEAARNVIRIEQVRAEQGRTRVYVQTVPEPQLTVSFRGATSRLVLKPVGRGSWWVTGLVKLRRGALVCASSGGGSTGYTPGRRCVRAA